MPEVSSISVSSYDPESLAPLLTEHVNDGWEVLGIVTAGTKIVAYLQREGSAAPADESTGTETEGAPAAGPPPAEAGAAAGAVVATDTGAVPPVEEPGGWAQAPEPAPPTPEPAPEPAPEPEPEPEPEPAPAPESTVPAGWYADPSGRFELRYWDGNAWTEHVSRAGQQYTDPPVA